MKNQSKYFGFSNANKSDEPAWFCSEAAAQRFAEACGWNEVEIETNDNPATDDIMDSPERPWYASTATIELTNDYHNKRTSIRVPGVVRAGESVEIGRHQFERAARQLCGVDGCACGTFTGGEGRCWGPDENGQYWLELRGRNGKYQQEPMTVFTDFTISPCSAGFGEYECGECCVSPQNSYALLQDLERAGELTAIEEALQAAEFQAAGIQDIRGRVHHQPGLIYARIDTDGAGTRVSYFGVQENQVRGDFYQR